MADSHPLPASHPTDRLLGTAPAIVALRAQIRHFAAFDTLGSPYVPTVLLQGETGTGKGLVARVFHDSGQRASGPFVDVNCAAIPETMLEAELFGFEPGAFTDAKRTKPGLFESAAGGTLFLDESDVLPLVLQSKLLTALESKRVQRLGAVTERPEAEELRQALVQAGGNVARAARLLGMSRDMLRYRMQRHRIARPRLETLSPPGAAETPLRPESLPAPRGGPQRLLLDLRP